MRHFAIGMAVGLATVLAPVAQAKAPPEAYSLRGNFRSVEISPDGKHIAMLAQQVGQSVVTISKIGGTTCRVGAGGNNLIGVAWANNDRLVVVAHVIAEWRVDGPNEFSDAFQPYSVNAECGDIKKLNGSGIVATTSDDQLIMTVPATNNSTSGEKNTRRWRANRGLLILHKVDPSTGKGEVWERGGDGTYGYLLDSEGYARARLDLDPTSGRFLTFARLGNSRDWQMVHDGRGAASNDDYYAFLELGPDPDTAYVRTRNGADRFGIYVFSFVEKRIVRPAFVRKDVDALGFAKGYVNGKIVPVGVVYGGDETTTEFFEPTYARIQADLAETFPGEKRSIVSLTKDLKGVVALVDGPTNPGGIYYYVDLTAGEVVELVKQRPRLTSADIGPVKFYRYSARDGYQVPAYLTLPNGSSGKGLPLVVMPHGGPESRDEEGFDSWSQFLSSRGYAVLRPQFRGSDGFGKAHRDAGRKQWGLRSQDDITDGVKDLIARGVADPKRVCIVGWSYGGYATLAGLAYTPELYRCGVAGAAVTDIPKLLEREAKNGGRWFRDDAEIVKMIGDIKTDYQRMVDTSPARNAERIRAPVMLIHPKFDSTVHPEQSEFMAEALKAAGKQYELRIIDGDDHNLKRESTGVEFLNILENFLGQHLR